MDAPAHETDDDPWPGTETKGVGKTRRKQARPSVGEPAPSLGNESLVTAIDGDRR